MGKIKIMTEYKMGFLPIKAQIQARETVLILELIKLKKEVVILQCMNICNLE